MTRTLCTALLAACAFASESAAQGPAPVADSSAIVGTVESFHRALAAGDSLGALALLTEHVVVLEAGGFETRAEFRDHHLMADIAYARSVRVERRVRSVTRSGDVAWVSTTSTATRTVDGREVQSLGAELMVLVLSPSGWRISAIHWSSRSRRPPQPPR